MNVHEKLAYPAPPGENETKMIILNEEVPNIIGQGGEILSVLQIDTFARIQVQMDPFLPDDQRMIVVIHKDWHTRKRALERILELFTWAMDPVSWIVLKGVDSGAVMQPSPTREKDRLSRSAFVRFNVTRTITVAGNMIALIIGKHGNMLWLIRSKSKTNIDLDPEQGRRNRWIKISGKDSRDIDCAISEIGKRVPWIRDEQGEFLHGSQLQVKSHNPYYVKTMPKMKNQFCAGTNKRARSSFPTLDMLKPNKKNKKKDKKEKKKKKKKSESTATPSRRRSFSVDSEFSLVIANSDVSDNEVRIGKDMPVDMSDI